MRTGRWRTRGAQAGCGGSSRCLLLRCRRRLNPVFTRHRHYTIARIWSVPCRGHGVISQVIGDSLDPRSWVRAGSFLGGGPWGLRRAGSPWWGRGRAGGGAGRRPGHGALVVLGAGARRWCRARRRGLARTAASAAGWSARRCWRWSRWVRPSDAVVGAGTPPPLGPVAGHQPADPALRNAVGAGCLALPAALNDDGGDHRACLGRRQTVTAGQPADRGDQLRSEVLCRHVGSRPRRPRRHRTGAGGDIKRPLSRSGIEPPDQPVMDVGHGFDRPLP
jgi:hypothetical protein